MTVGAFGEELTAGLYRRLGYRVVARNHRVGRFEADLVVENGGRRVVVEVKTVIDGDPFGRVDTAKERALFGLASELGATRVDVVGIRLQPDGAHLHLARGW